MIILDRDSTHDYLRRAVSEYGREYVDPQAKKGDACSNVYFDARGEVAARCIAAQVLSYAGVSDEALHNCDGDISTTLRHLNVSIKVSPLALLMLITAQRVQDSGATWRQALGSVDGAWSPTIAHFLSDEPLSISELLK